MDRRTFLKASGVAGTGALAGCIGDDGDEIVIGAIQPLSGPFGPWGNAHQAGLEYAVDEINEDGGILDREVELVSSDTGSDPSSADEDFRGFVERQNAVAVTGPVSSDVGVRTSDTAHELQTPLFLHMAGEDGIVRDGREYTFRVGLLPASNTMIAQNQLIQEQGYERVGAIIGDYAWGRAVEEAMEQHFDVDVNIQVAPVDEDDFRPYLRNLDEDTELLNATGHPPGNFSITGQALDIGMEPDAVTGSGFPPAVIRGALEDTADDMYLHYHMSDYTTSDYVGIAEDFAATDDGEFDTHHSYGYVTAYLIAAAIEEAGEADPQAITETVRDIEFETLYAEALQYANFGEPNNQVQIYSTFKSEPSDYAPDRDWGLEEVFRSDPLPAAE